MAKKTKFLEIPIGVPGDFPKKYAFLAVVLEPEAV